MPELSEPFSQPLQQLPATLVEAIIVAPLPDLDETPSDPKLADAITGELGEWSDVGALQKQLAESGLWLLAGDLHRSHSISQNITAAEGSFWHGIMHRREGDFGNSKYWFRKVGQHPVLQQINEATDSQYQDPFKFVDRCANALAGNPADRAACQQIQWVEWQALMVYGVQ